MSSLEQIRKYYLENYTIVAEIEQIKDPAQREMIWRGFQRIKEAHFASREAIAEIAAGSCISLISIGLTREEAEREVDEFCAGQEQMERERPGEGITL